MRYLSLFLLIFFVSCKKTKTEGPDNREFTGVVLDYSSGQPLAGAVVKIIRIPVVPDLKGLDPGWVRGLQTDLFQNIRVDSVLTAADGSYSIQLDASQPPFSRYMVAAWKEGYIHPYILPTVHLIDSTYMRDTSYLDRNSYLKIVINNQLPADSTDSLGLKTFYLDSVSQNAYLRPGSLDSVSFIGLTNNVVLMDTISARAYPKAKVWWTVRNGSFFLRDSQVVDLVPFGITEVQVNY
jgi:hypothetical protein